ncbi:MAG: RAD55 family ATPase, partial [Nitrososphaeria archaeon]
AIRGGPGTGKTTLAVLGCIRKGGCTYLTYMEPEMSIMKKFSLIEKGFKGDVEILSMMSGEPSHAYSIIMDSLARGKCVVVDSMNSMFYGISDTGSVRSFLQLLYTAAKGKDGTLILITEGEALPPPIDISFVADAIIDLSYDEVLDGRVRKASILKDRDHPIEEPILYFTIHNGLSFFPKIRGVEAEKIGRAQIISRPPEAEIVSERVYGFNVLYDIDDSVPQTFTRYFWELLASDFVLSGYKATFFLGPDEDPKIMENELRMLLGTASDYVGVRTINLESMRYDLNAVYSYLQKILQLEPEVLILNLSSLEELALRDPVGFENLLRKLLKLNIEQRRISFYYGYSSYRSIRVGSKYIGAKRALILKNGYLFWRSIKPPGELYSVNIDMSKGELSFTPVR